MSTHASLHLVKLAVGPESLSDLTAWQERRLREQRHEKQQPELMHITRQMPKRAEELLRGGSLYWVIKGAICARQRLLELRPLMRNGVPHCGIVYDSEIIRVVPRPRRPFQGWRYLQPADAPPDLITDAGDVPEEMLRELTELGLI